MRNIVIAAAGLAAAVLPVTAASAQYHGGYRYDRVRAEQRECRRELRRADNRWEYRRELAECRREIARARYGRHDRYGHRYYR